MKPVISGRRIRSCMPITRRRKFRAIQQAEAFGL